MPKQQRAAKRQSTGAPPPVDTRPTKRRQQPPSPTANDDHEAALDDDLRVLVSCVLEAFGLPPDLAMTTDPPLHRRRAAPGVGIGVFTSDVAVRLFHTHIRARGDGPQAFASSVEFAIACAESMQAAINAGTTTSQFRVLTAVRAATPDDRRRGVHPDRLVLCARDRGPRRSAPLATTRAQLASAGVPILYVDEAVLVVDKPAGLLSVEGRNANVPSVRALIRQSLPDARAVHRLDQETSGILIFALTRSAAQDLCRQFRDRTIDKAYVARVHGRMATGEGVVAVRMAPSRSARLLQHVVDDNDDDVSPHDDGPGEEDAVQDPDGDHGDFSDHAPDDSTTSSRRRAAKTRTIWRVLCPPTGDGDGDRTWSEWPGPTTLVALTPITGKTHQLRVHMHHLGHAILGDSLYAPPPVRALAPRLLLHAASLAFTHPHDGRRLTITSPCPFT